ncbi:MAG: hypothetical protein EON87_13905, partial [Brevundimonas sp.]
PPPASLQPAPPPASGGTARRPGSAPPSSTPPATCPDCSPSPPPSEPHTAGTARWAAALNLACVQFRLTPEEALAGATRVAAKALGLTDVGTIEPGKAADLAVWDIRRPAELCYWLGKPLLHSRYVGGMVG